MNTEQTEEIFFDIYVQHQRNMLELQIRVVFRI